MSLLQDVLKANLDDIERLKNGRINGNRRSSSEEKDDSDEDLVNVVSQFLVSLANFFLPRSIHRFLSPHHQRGQELLHLSEALLHVLLEGHSFSQQVVLTP